MIENSKSTFNLEHSLKTLEDITQEMEAGDIQLERSLALFEQGIRLVKSCQKFLDKAEQKVQLLTEENGKFNLKPLDDLE